MGDVLENNIYEFINQFEYYDEGKGFIKTRDVKDEGK